MSDRTVNGYRVFRGFPLPFGASHTADGVNYSIFSKNATGATLVLFKSGLVEAQAEIELDPENNRTGNVWHVEVGGADASVRYGWRMAGPYDPQQGHLFNKDRILLDPYASAITGGAVWGEPDIRHGEDPEGQDNQFLRRSALAPAEFEWGNTRPPHHHLEDSVIYELHLRGFTIHPSSGVVKPGTYLGLTEKIPYLKELGVTAVELMPVFEFDENEHMRHAKSGEILRNYWGYSPVSFFAPKASYSSNGRDGQQVNEFRQMIKNFHDAGIEVYLDVVFNHTAEGDERGPTLSFRGIDNATFYILDEDGKYKNYSGCGNTVNCNDPNTRALIIDSLRYWVAHMRVDGFRFDLASILGRGEDGEVLKDPPLLERIANDPVLADTKLIAEAWDAAGLNQVGKFPGFGRCSEWNGYYRDNVRMFWRGDEGMVSALASRICGSDDLYKTSTRQSINFITAHDGFTLNDLVSYNGKHNEANGEENRDGENHNHSMNFGVEGPTDDHNVNRRRMRMMKNMLSTLLLSQGVPMILGGDEFARTQKGNNNAYCQDNDISWVDWELCDKNAGLVRFVRLMIKLRRELPSLRRRNFFKDGVGISWHGEKRNKADWGSEAKWLAFMLDSLEDCPHLYVMMNASQDYRHFAVPHVGKEWVVYADTHHSSPDDICEDIENATVVGYEHKKYRVHPQSTVVLITR